MKASIIDYLGKYEGGILVNINIMLEDECFDSIFYYTSDKMIITIEDSFVDKWGPVEKQDDYLNLMESIINMVEPYDSVITQLDDYKMI
jgi:hypothetical protein